MPTIPQSLGSTTRWDMLRAHRIVKTVMKDRHISYEFMVKLIGSWKKEMARMKHGTTYMPVDNRTFQRCEMIIAFAEDFHAENIRKHESYKKGNPDEQDIRQLELRRTLYR